MENKCGSQCETCEKRKDCGIEGVMSYIDEHEEEVSTFRDGDADRMSIILSFRGMKHHPELLPFADVLPGLLKMAAVAGFVKGRMYTDIPEIFQEGKESIPYKFSTGDRVRVNRCPSVPEYEGKEGIVSRLGSHSHNEGAVVVNKDFVGGDSSYGEHGMWFPDSWLELVD